MEQKTIKTLKAEFKAANAKLQLAMDESFTRDHVSPKERARLNANRIAAGKAMSAASVALINAQVAANHFVDPGAFSPE